MTQHYFAYNSPENITFHGVIDSGYTEEDWKHLPEPRRDMAREEAVWSVIELWDASVDDLIEEGIIDEFEDDEDE